MNDKELTDRIKNAIILLSDRHSFKVGDLTFGCDNQNNFFVSGWVESHELKNISKTRAINELTETKQLFSKMLAVSTDLKKFIENRNVEYSLCYNYGMGSIELCKERKGNIEWTLELIGN
ncbi:hypothetical protein [Mariniradius saccharolyticus]|uniref:hypothetical protein n=1 Tax=Mariniradius saccharolyticus TaxID=1245591 RepID=UPI00058B858C|nr:hypothetical protein [Mariniradius saccharolyticus]